MPIWGAVVLRHEKGLSTTFKPQGSTIVGFSKIDKLSTCGFVFALFSMVWALRVNVVDGPLLWQGADLRLRVAKKATSQKDCWKLRWNSSCFCC